jgi:hypothetical protein
MSVNLDRAERFVLANARLLDRHRLAVALCSPTSRLRLTSTGKPTVATVSKVALAAVALHDGTI